MAQITLLNNGKNSPFCFPWSGVLSRSAKLDSLDRLKQLSKMDRKAELERKKAKLQALREEKDRRRREKEQKDIEDAKAGITAPEKDTRKWVERAVPYWADLLIFQLLCFTYIFRDLDEMLTSLGVAPVSEVLSSLSSVNSATSDHSANQTPDASLQHVNGTWVDTSMS